MLVIGVLAAAASATITVSSFTLTPSTTQAGGTTTTPGPDLNVNAAFSTANGDSPQNILLSLAPGLMANPSVVPYCSSTAFKADNCPAASQIGQGTITGTAPQFGTTLNLPATAYLVQPAGSEIADLGVIATFFDYPVATQTGPVNIRTTPNTGIDIPLNGLPNTIEGVSVLINGLNLTINGAVGGKTFTRNPTSCSAATSTLTSQSYAAPTTNVTATSNFTPTGCSSLPYTPTVGGTVTEDSNGDGGIAIAANIGSAYNQADSQSIQLTFPFSASPRLGTFLADQCTPATTGNPWAACTSVGTATITTPLLTSPLTANVYLQQHTNALPTLQIVIPPPFNITLTGTPILTGTAVQALVANVPDIPITSLALNLPGGANSLFLAGVHMCTSPQSFGGTFTSWSGVTATPSSAATVNGCPTTPPAAAPLTAAGSTTTGDTTTSSTGSTALVKKHRIATGSGSAQLAGESTALVNYTGLHGSSPRVVLAVGGGRKTAAIRSVTLRLPTGFGIASSRPTAGLRVSVNGRFVRYTARYNRGLLTISFARTGRVAFISIAAPALAVSRSIRAQHRGRLTLIATLNRITGKPTTLHLVARER
jgi:hypothetical protein